jgi:hypothetical protein
MTLLLRTGLTPISTVMRRLLTGHAVQFNRRHRRHGHLFQNRYKSILCQEDPYLMELVRYIHLNPLRAKLVADYKSLRRFSYAGHCALMGRTLISERELIQSLSNGSNALFMKIPVSAVRLCHSAPK